jgi:hypothetical protein
VDQASAMVGGIAVNRVLAFGVAAVLCVGACSTSGTPGPHPSTQAAFTSEPTPPPTERSSPTPVDVGQAFLTRIVAATKGRMTLSGLLQVGSEIGAVDGSLTYVGADSDQTLSVTIGGSVRIVSNVHLGGVGYTKVDGRPWLRDAASPKAGTDLATQLGKLTAVIDAGVVAHDGVDSHRLELPAGTVIPAAAFGLTDQPLVNPTVEVVFHAADDGTPLTISVTASSERTIDGSETPVIMSLDLTYLQIGGNPTVQAPDHVWNRFTSTSYHYGLAFPDGWNVVTSVEGHDYFDAPRDDYFSATREKLSGLTLGAFVADEISVYETRFHWTFDANAAVTIGGAKARLVTFHGTVADRKVVIYEVFSLKRGYAYDLTWKSPKGPHDAAALALFRQILATFAFA